MKSVKRLILAWLTLSSALVFAESTEIGLPTDAISLQPLSGAVEKINVTIEGTRLEIAFTAKNCVDQVTPIVYKQSGSVVLMSVWNISRKLSFWAPCADFPVYRSEIFLPALRPPFRIEFMGTDESVLVP